MVKIQLTFNPEEENANTKLYLWAPSLGTPPSSGSCTLCYFFYLNELSHLKKTKQKKLVTHTCNPSYLGGRDQVDQGFKPD
jgi:hypothetical protein